MHWLPMFEFAQSQGCDVRAIWFPRVSDPDHMGLEMVDMPALLKAPIGRDFAPTETSSDQLYARVHDQIGAFSPDVILSCTPHVGPEASLLDITPLGPRRPCIVGLQHGFVQPWDYLEGLWPFDFFAVFGPIFKRVMPSREGRVICASYPKADEIRPRSRGGGHRVLFAAQGTPTPDRLRLLLRELERTGYQPTVRPHPELRDAFSGLREEFEFRDDGVFHEIIHDFDLVVTTGSSTVIECLVAEVPVVVLPLQGGEQFAEFGITARSLDADGIQDVAERYRDPMFAEQARAKILGGHELLKGRTAAEFSFEAIRDTVDRWHSEGALQTAKAPAGMEGTPDWDRPNENRLVSILGLSGPLSDTWPSLTRNKRASALAIAKYVDVQPTDTVAEIGAGSGLITATLSQIARQVHSIDCSFHLQRIAKSIAGSPNVHFHLIDPGDLTKIKDAGVDKIISEGCFILLGLFEIFIYARQAFNILPSGGRLAFDISNADRPNLWDEGPWVSHLAAYERDKSRRGLQTWHSPSSIKSLLENVGFFVEAIHNPGWMYTWIVARKP
jgi:hypothetical protein